MIGGLGRQERSQDGSSVEVHAGVPGGGGASAPRAGCVGRGERDLRSSQTPPGSIPGWAMQTSTAHKTRSCAYSSIAPVTAMAAVAPAFTVPSRFFKAAESSWTRLLPPQTEGKDRSCRRWTGRAWYLPRRSWETAPTQAGRRPDLRVRMQHRPRSDQGTRMPLRSQLRRSSGNVLYAWRRSLSRWSYRAQDNPRGGHPPAPARKARDRWAKGGEGSQLQCRQPRGSRQARRAFADQRPGGGGRRPPRRRNRVPPTRGRRGCAPLPRGQPVRSLGR
jgi:hypothetical protein